MYDVQDHMRLLEKLLVKHKRGENKDSMFGMIMEGL